MKNEKADRTKPGPKRSLTHFEEFILLMQLKVDLFMIDL